MEEVSTAFKKVQRVLNILLKTPDTLEALTNIQTSHNQDWEEFQAAVNNAHKTLKDEAEHGQITELVIKAQKTHSTVMEGLAAKIEKIKTNTRDAAQAKNTAEQTNKPTALEQTIPLEPIQIQPSTSAMEADDVVALRALLQQIANQYNDILAGKYPSPTTIASAMEQLDPMLGEAPEEGSSQDNENVSVPKGHKHCLREGEAKSMLQEILDGFKTDLLQQIRSEPHNAAPTNNIPPNTDETTGENSPTNTTGPVNPTNDIQQPTIELKMDKFTLPTFDGDLTNWLPFKDQFTDLVDTNPKFTAITKFIQLRSHLKGTALEAIAGFKLSSASYDAAWQILKKRYDKPDRIIDEYLRKLDELPMLHFASAQSLIAMVNCTNQILRVLPVLGVDVTTWDTIIKYKLTTKLDRTTHKKWLDQVKLRQNVPLQELVEFLEVEASENVPFDTKRERHVDHRKPQRFKQRTAAILPAVAGTEQQPNINKCPQCKGQHPIYMCGIFKKLAVKDRFSKIKAFKLCTRCLRKHEHPNDCRFGMCPTCSKDHNSLLCYTKERQQNKEVSSHVANFTSKPE